jgi:transposase InsO family protein
VINIHSDCGTQFTSWTFTQRVKEAKLMPSVGRTGTALDNAMMESFWGQMQVELLNRRSTPLTAVLKSRQARPPVREIASNRGSWSV